ncbi:MAG: multicopper oxidase family protein [Methylovulum sp.]|nr:multicopper oxidase family protein [Methylovulum sp.]
MGEQYDIRVDNNTDLGRRRVLFLAMFGALGGAATVLGGWPRRSLAEALDAGEVALQEPPVLTSSAGVLQAALRATTKPVTVAGQLISGAMTYNGHYPGPTLRVKPGDRIRLRVRNNLTLPDATPMDGMDMAPNTLNTHFHGLHVSPLPKADDIYLQIPFGGVYDYDFQVPDKHPGGLYWYHPHVHGVVDAQIYAGLAGMLLVDGGAEQIPALQGVGQRLLALKNIAIKDGALATGVAPAEQQHTVNGQLSPTIALRPGETQLWRVVNIGNEPYYQLSLDGHTFTVVAEDGSMLWESYSTDTLLLPPGKRFEFTVTGAKVGRYAFRTLGYDSGPYGGWTAAELATVVVAGAKDTPRVVPVQLGVAPAYLNGPVTKRRVVKFSEGFSAATNTPFFELNGKVYEPLSNGARIKLGTTEEWLLFNDITRTKAQDGALEEHPFHIHVNDFVVMEIDGKPVKAYGSQDVVNVRSGQKILIRMAFPDFVGKSVFHCHILFHEDNGMMANFEIVP